MAMIFPVSFWKVECDKVVCPLSPLLFAVCVDILLRMIIHVAPECTCKAFADDIAALLTDWWKQGPVLERVFQEFE